MRLAYMDEVGNTGRDLRNPEQRFHMIVTVVVDEERISDLHEQVRAVARKHFSNDHWRPDFEFHGYDLFGGNGYCSGRTPTERIQIYDDLLSVIGAVDAQVIARGVESPAWPHGTPPRSTRTT